MIDVAEVEDSSPDSIRVIIVSLAERRAGTPGDLRISIRTSFLGLERLF